MFGKNHGQALIERFKVGWRPVGDLRSLQTPTLNVH